MEHCRFVQFEVQREEPTHQLFDVRAVHLLCWYKKQQEHLKTSNVRQRKDLFLHSTQRAVMSAKIIILQN